MKRNLFLVAVIVLVLAAMVSPAAALVYQKVSIDSIANDVLSTYIVSPPTGDLVLGGVPFCISSQAPNVFLSEDDGYGTGHSAAGVLNTYVERPIMANVLIAGASSRSEFLGSMIGMIDFTCVNGSAQSVNLVVGGNIKDWVAVPWLSVVTTTTDPMVSSAWSGTSQEYWGSSPVTIEMLRVPLQAASPLQRITIVDTSLDNINNVAPGLFIYGVTIEASAVPEPASALALIAGLVFVPFGLSRLDSFALHVSL